MKHDLIPNFSCVVTAPTNEKDAVNHLKEATDAGYPIIYILGSGGDKYVRRCFGRGEDGEVRYSQRKTLTIPGLAMGEIKDEDNFLPAGKIPMTLLWEVQKFFKAVIAKFGDTNLEAFILIMWNADQGYFLHVPSQTVSGAAVSYNPAELPARSRIIVDIHSHANFGAFFSGTDERDDKDTVRYSGVIGFNRRPDPEMKFRFNFLDLKTPVNVTDIFDVPRSEVQDTPVAWLENVKNSSVQYSKGSYQGNQGSNHGYSHSRHFAEDFQSGGGRGGYYGSQGYVPASKYTAPMPSNATCAGVRQGKDIWHLKGGGYITLDEWEESYPKIIAAQEKAEQEAAENGGQQGTLPLELSGPTGPESGTSSSSQRGPSEANPFPTLTDQRKPNESVKPDSSSNSSSNNFANSVSRYLSGQSSPNSSSQAETSSSQSSNSAGHSTPRLSGQTREPISESEPASLTSIPSTTILSPSTSTASPDSLGIFTESKPQAYISEDQDGYSVLTLVTVKPADPVEDQYQQEMKRWQQGRAPEGVVPVGVPELQSTKKIVTGETSEVDPLGGRFQPPTLQVRPPTTPTLIRRSIPVVPLPESESGFNRWLDRRQQTMRDDTGASITPIVQPISDRLVDKMHHREQQESLLENEAELEELQSGLAALFQTQGATGTITVWPDSTVTMRLEKADLPADFDVNCIDFGKEAAGAKAVVDASIPTLSESGTLFRETVRSMFEQLDEEERLPMFRTLAQSLSSQARTTLATSGL